MKSAILTVITSLIVVSACAGDILTLNNLMSFEGEVTKIKNCIVQFRAQGETFIVPVSEIYSLEFEDTNDKVYTKYLGLSDEDPSKCMNGRADSDALHGKRGEHVVLGFLFGPLAIIGTTFSNPRPETGMKTMADSEHKDLFDDPQYLKCYKRRTKGSLIGSEMMGIAIWAFTYFAYRTLKK